MAFGRVRAGVSALLLAAACGPAEAATGTVQASLQPEGYARLIFTFDDLPTFQARIASNVLVVRFGEPVALEAGGIAAALPGLVTVARRDPDGTSIQLALTRAAKLSVTEAGDALYVDVLPQDWKGLPPGLPKEVVAELGRAAKSARTAEADRAMLNGARLKPVTLQAATHPTFRRLVFRLDDGVPVEMARAGDQVAVKIGAPAPFDLAAAKAALPAELQGLDASRTKTALTIFAPAPEAVDVRGFREDGTYVLDIDRPKAEIGGAPVAGDRRGMAAPAVAPAQDPHPAVPGGDGGHAAAPVATPAEASAADDHGAAAQAQPATDHAPEGHAAPASPAPSAGARAATPGRATLQLVGDTLRIAFSFEKPVPTAVFARGRIVWAVFDDPAPLALDGLVDGSRGVLAAAVQTDIPNGRVVRLTLAENRPVTAAADGAGWVISLGDDMLAAAAPIAVAPAFGRDGRGSVSARLDGLGQVRRLADPVVGDELIVATLGGPARGVLRPQSFVEFGLLATAQGVAVAALADDLRVSAEMDQLAIERDRGLTLSPDAPPVAAAPPPSTAAVIVLADAGPAPAEPYAAREKRLLEAAALAKPAARTDARVDLARFYLLGGMAAEAKGVLDVAVGDDALAARSPRVGLLRAAAAAELGQAKEARALLDQPMLAHNAEAALWRASTEFQDGRMAPARAALAQGAPALDALPPDLRSRFVELAVALALDADDRVAAATAFDQLDVLPAIRGVGAREVLRGRVFEALGQTDKALAAYRAVLGGHEPIAAAEAQLRSVALRLLAGKSSTDEAIKELERLVTGWRGDWIEAEALARLSFLYADAGRWRDAFTTLRVSVEAFPDAEDIRALQDRMQGRFTELFLGPAVDRMPKLEALALFYDFQELSPGGRRGDELVRRLADKLVEVDLLDQAAELLEYQVDNRLTGAARAQVAARAALVRLMNNKPAEALKLLGRTRQADLPASLVRLRLTLEARALARYGRTELALEMAEGLGGADAARLRADILWSARRWGEAGEALEAALGSSWRRPEPLDAAERANVMRAAVALSLADDALGLDRLRQKFAARMADSRDARAFEVVTAPIEARGDAFRDIARSIAATAALEGFLKDYRTRGPEAPAPAAAPEREAAVPAPARG